MKEKINTGKFIERTNKKEFARSQEEIRESISRLETPLRKINYGERGEEDVTWDNLRFHFSYTPIDTTDETAMRGLRSHIDHFIKTRDGSSNSIYADINSWRKLDSFVVFKEGSPDGKNVIPDTDNIFFCPLSDQTGGSAVKELNSAFFHNDLAKPRTIISILHELGHRWDFRNLQQDNTESFMADHRYLDQAERLRAEKTATAFALKTLKIMRSDKQAWQDINTFLKDYALSFEYETLKSNISSVSSEKDKKSNFSGFLSDDEGLEQFGYTEYIRSQEEALRRWGQDDPNAYQTFIESTKSKEYSDRQLEINKKLKELGYLNKR